MEPNTNHISLDYDEMVKKDYIPLLNEGVPRELGAYPPWVDKKHDHVFGMFMEYVIRGILSNLYPSSEERVTFISTTEENYQIIESYYQIYLSESLSKSFFKPIVNWIKEEWGSYGLGDPKYDVEYSYHKWVRKPSIITETTILEVKTCSDFTQESKKTWMKLLVDYVIIKTLGLNIKNIGVILPLQRIMIIYNLKDWNYHKFFEYINSDINNQSPEDLPDNLLGNILDNVGNHVRNDKSIVISLDKYIKVRGNVPCQMFLCSPQTGKRRKYSDEEIKEAYEFIKTKGIRYFTHSAYCVNLCGDKEWMLKIVKEDLRLTNQIGGRGVVVHVGKRKTLSMKEGLDRMEQSIRLILESASNATPLLLETPAGEGTELCVKIEEMMDFYNRFSRDDKMILRLCIDTCHIFAAGYEPMEYIERWSQEMGHGSIGLIHLNDSKKDKGSRVDRHAFFGTGYIGSERLSQVIMWAHVHRIPMVIE